MDAPIKSRKLGNPGNDNKRFDIYTPSRIFKMRAETQEEADLWVEKL
jgi:hypothetical protein